MTIYHVTLGFVSKDPDSQQWREKRYELHLDYANPSLCVQAVIRWIIGRQKAVPDYFNKIAWINIQTWSADIVGEDSRTVHLEPHKMLFIYKEGQIYLGDEYWPNRFPFDDGRFVTDPLGMPVNRGA